MQKNNSNSYHYFLNLPVEFIPQPLDMTDGYHKIYPVNRVNSELREFLNSLGCDVGHGEQFLLEPNGRADTHIIHCDSADDLPLVKLNYVYCDSAHTMNWYELLPGKAVTVARSTADTEYLTCSYEDVIKVYSAEVGQPSLVNVKKLHDVAPVLSQRTCYSLALVDSQTQKRLCWSEAVDLFKNYIIDK